MPGVPILHDNVAGSLQASFSSRTIGRNSISRKLCLCALPSVQPVLFPCSCPPQRYYRGVEVHRSDECWEDALCECNQQLRTT
eukprot:360129-Chlamydomonas_euryale.AAC.3